MNTHNIKLLFVETLMLSININKNKIYNNRVEYMIVGQKK